MKVETTVSETGLEVHLLYTNPLSKAILDELSKLDDGHFSLARTERGIVFKKAAPESSPTQARITALVA